MNFQNIAKEYTNIKLGKGGSNGNKALTKYVQFINLFIVLHLYLHLDIQGMGIKTVVQKIIEGSRHEEVW